MKFSNKYLLVSLITLIVLFASCKKDPLSLVGGDIQPPSEYINSKFNDTAACLNIFAHSLKGKDSIPTSGYSTLWLGSFNNPYFGSVSANIITQILPEYSKYDSTYANAPNLVDSVILCLTLVTAYPYDTITKIMHPMTIKVGELTEADTISSTSTSNIYYSNHDMPHNSGSITPFHTFTPSLTDSIYQGSDTVKTWNNVVRIPLSNEYGQNLLNAAINLMSVGVFNDFLKVVKGLYIEALPEMGLDAGQLLSINLSATTSRIVVYHKKTVEDTASTATAFFPRFSGSVTYNYYSFDRSNADADFIAQINGNNYALGQNRLFIQGFGSSEIQLEIPDILQLDSVLSDSNQIVINNADLVLYVDSSAVGRFTPSNQLILATHKGDTLTAILDQSSYIGGIYNSSKGEYRFNITRHIAHLLLTKERGENPTLYISDYNNNIQPSCIVLHGADKALNQEKRMRIEVLYSIVPRQ